ncbi:hypothetical protein GNI_069330 [Gregarina niphandrodes]|uniref:Uncharacterized protein n=1 Tax=Gregarina niphandrodes TaxID=110365 RepID=A0A023B7F6_GRENI|nr:hypothetical protein GNI_069330 [Gregarina niphandrodes]EZG67338.1 hypothetical protein GNI_069330 [Gregarina niphandrodes]|eukprot:XP_011130264.1 hypothetical protein GNI_069330 [Gregarina niphandrodes]
MSLRNLCRIARNTHFRCRHRHYCRLFTDLRESCTGRLCRLAEHGPQSRPHIPPAVTPILVGLGYKLRPEEDFLILLCHRRIPPHIPLRLSGHPLRLSGHPLRLSGHPLRLSGHPLRLLTLLRV